jgi:hypothetical protein
MWLGVRTTCGDEEVIRLLPRRHNRHQYRSRTFLRSSPPERGEERFTGATEFTRLLVSSQVRLEDSPRLEYTYGRRIAYIFDSSGNSIDVQLIAAGFAKTWTRDGQHKDTLVGLEESAKSNKAGCLCGV